MEFQTLLDTRHSKTYELARNAWCGDYNEASTFLSLLDSKSEQNDQGYANADVDTWLADSKTSRPIRTCSMREVEAQVGQGRADHAGLLLCQGVHAVDEREGLALRMDVEQNWYAKDLYKVAE